MLAQGSTQKGKKENKEKTVLFLPHISSMLPALVFLNQVQTIAAFLSGSLETEMKYDQKEPFRNVRTKSSRAILYVFMILSR